MVTRNFCGASSVVLSLLLLPLVGDWTPLAAQAPQSAVAETQTLEGTLEVIYEDSDRGSRLLHFLDTGAQRLPLRFQGAAPDLPSGSRVRVRAYAADGALTATSVTSIAVSPSRTLGQQDVLVILINFANDKSQPYAPSSTSTVNTQATDFYLENSYGQTPLTFAVTGWHTIAASSGGCDYSTFASQADAAATAAGINIAAYDRLIYAFPQTSACAWWGLGYVAGPRAWINGSYALRVVAHELGHTFGNHHSMSLNCDSGTCAAVEYGDDRDVMGVPGTVGHTNAFQKERLGWLDYGASPAIQTVTSSNSYWLDPVSTAGTGQPKALKIWNPVTSSYYYIETRAQVGFDTNVAPGVVLHSGSPTTTNGYQLDMAPLTATRDSTLDPGQTFSDAAMALHVTTLAADATGALVQVDLGTLPCTTAAPTVTMSPVDTRWVRAGVALGYTLSVRNNSSSSCGPAAMTLSASTTLPSGWTATFGSQSVSVAPGNTISIAATITPSPSTPAGLYSLTMTAGDGSTAQTASVSGTAWVAQALDVGIGATLKVSARETTIAVATGVRIAQSTAVAGAAVTVKLRNPMGSTTTLAGTTNSAGNVTVTFKLNKRKDPQGTYTVTVTADKAGIPGTASTALNVQ